MEYKEYGHFSQDGLEYVITERKTPRHWYNYFFNEHFNAFTSQVGYGEAFAEDALANRIWLVSDRSIYICDKEAKSFHNALGLPMTLGFDFYECRHGLGYSVITTVKNGIRTEFTIFVPETVDAEHWIIKVTNERSTEAKLGAIAYAATETDNIYRPQSYNSDGGYYDEKNNLIYATMMSKFGGDMTSQKTRYGYMAASEPIASFDTRKNAFIGTYGNKDMPEALVENCGCTGSECYVEKLCYAIECDCVLASGQTKRFDFKMGYVTEKSELDTARDSLLNGEPNRLLAELKALRLAENDGVSIKTPDEKLNKAFNGFYKYSTNMGSRWARVRHNGYRDRTGDTEAFACINPEKALKRLIMALEYQYASGYAPRTVSDGKVRDNNFSDCAVWIAPAVDTLVRETGNIDILNMPVKFNDGSVGSIYEHARRSVEFLYNFKAPNGLIKIWGGDWNDGMNLAGLQGKGCSVWLSIAWVKSNKTLIKLAKLMGDEETVKRHEEYGKAMAKLIDEYGWDGEYYITAINDWGEKIGSKESKYGKMFLNPQTWAVFADLKPRDELLKLYEKVDKYLDTPLGALVNAPGWDESDCRVGFMTFRPKGTLINSAVYLHPMGWKLSAEAMLRRADKVGETIEKILPWNHKHAITYGEPYILYNFYHTDEAKYRSGTPGQSWRTGSTSSFTKAMVNNVFGISPEVDGLRIAPCLPPDWKACSAVKKFRGAVYEISYENGGSGYDVEGIYVDGARLDKDILPFEKGKTYKVRVVIK